MCSGGVVGYHARLTRARSRVRSSSRVLLFLFLQLTKKKSTSGEVRTHALKRGPELESGALTTRPQMLPRETTARHAPSAATAASSVVDLPRSLVG